MVIVAEHITQQWNTRGNCMLVAGATYQTMCAAFALAGEMTLLRAWHRHAGRDIEQVMLAGMNSQGRGMIVNASRAVIFADDPEAAGALRDFTNSYR